MSKYTYCVKMGDQYSVGDGATLTPNREDAYIFTEDDKELKFFVELGFFDDVEHWAQRHQAQLGGDARVVRINADGIEEEECVN